MAGRWQSTMGILTALAVSAVPQQQGNQPVGQTPPGQAPAEQAPADRFVTADRLPLRLSPSAPAHAEIERGAAVHVLEEKDGWARVTIWGWVPSDQLAADRPELTAAEAIGPSGPAAAPERKEPLRRDIAAIPDVDANGQKISDLRRAVRLAVITVPEVKEQELQGIDVGLGFLAPPNPGVLVSFEEPKIDVELTLYEKRILAGAQTHGAQLFTGHVTLTRWQDGLVTSGKVRIAMKDVDLSNTRTEVGILVARATLPNGYVVYGRDYDVVVRKPQKPAEAPKPDQQKKGG